jgi:hypothetical protein
MKYFLLPNIIKSLLSIKVVNYLIDVGNTIEKSNWSIRPLKFDKHHEHLVKPIVDLLPKPPVSMALLMTPALSVSGTHLDNLPNPPSPDGIQKITGRITAINLSLQSHCSSHFEYVDEMNFVTDQLEFNHATCVRVDIPHRVNNLHNPQNRITLSFSYLDTISELYSAYQKTNENNLILV